MANGGATLSLSDYRNLRRPFLRRWSRRLHLLLLAFSFNRSCVYLYSIVHGDLLSKMLLAVLFLPDSLNAVVIHQPIWLAFPRHQQSKLSDHQNYRLFGIFILLLRVFSRWYTNKTTIGNLPPISRLIDCPAMRESEKNEKRGRCLLYWSLSPQETFQCAGYIIIPGELLSMNIPRGQFTSATGLCRQTALWWQCGFSEKQIKRFPSSAVLYFIVVFWLYVQLGTKVHRSYDTVVVRLGTVQVQSSVANR
jgi:hypothetical protein